jgi:hypothetical protein
VIATKRRKQWAVAAACIAYLGSYTYFSLNGQFLTAGHGGSDYSREWSPKYLVVDTTAGGPRPHRGFTALGLLYLPCILLDRLLWHPGPRKFLRGEVVYHDDVSDWPSHHDGAGTHWTKEGVVYTDRNGDGIIDLRVENREAGQIVSLRTCVRSRPTLRHGTDALPVGPDR